MNADFYEYLEKLNEEKPPIYFVDDVFNADKELVEFLFVLESPHKEEVINSVPLMGNSGIDVSKFLYGRKETIPFGKKISTITVPKIGIINVSNIPLQVIKEDVANTNYPVADKVRQKLQEFRDSKTIKKDDKLYPFFSKKMDDFPNVKIFIICGTFAEKYFDKYVIEQNENFILKKQYKGEIEILKVPHPSYGHWQFIDKHKDNLERLKEIFSEFNEE